MEAACGAPLVLQALLGAPEAGYPNAALLVRAVAATVKVRRRVKRVKEGWSCIHTYVCVFVCMSI